MPVGVGATTELDTGQMSWSEKRSRDYYKRIEMHNTYGTRILKAHRQ